MHDLGTGYYSIIARHSGKCLTVPDGSTADSVQLQQSTCTGATYQQWKITDLGTGYLHRCGPTQRKVHQHRQLVHG